MRHWIGNDKNRRSHHGVVLLSENTLKIRLDWRICDASPALIVGEFDLDLNYLLTNEYVRHDRGKTGAIRLRFYHGLDDKIYIQKNLKSPAYFVGDFPSF